MASQRMMFYFCIAVLVLQMINISTAAGIKPYRQVAKRVRRQDEPQLCIPGESCNNIGAQMRPVSGCGRFCKCDGSSWKVQNCGLGTLFNYDVQVCDHYYNVECPVALAPICTPGDSCTPDESARRMPGCQSYCQCSLSTDGYVWKELSCQGSDLFNVDIQLCDLPGIVECPESSPDPLCTVGDICSKDEKMRRMPGDCKSFCVCAKSKQDYVWMKTECSPNSQFSYVFQGCNYPEQVECAGNGLSPEPQLCNPGDPCADDGKVRAFDDCKSYCMCDNEVWKMYNCSPSYRFDNAAQKCQSPEVFVGCPIE